MAKPLYDHIGKNYDITRKADPEIVRRLRYHLQVPDGANILDAACGTGDYTIALNQTGLNMTGSDVSSDMVRNANAKSSQIPWELADIARLPYKDKVFDGATCILSVHHFNSLPLACQEIYRVINKGRFVIFTSSPEQMAGYWLKEYFPDSMKKAAAQMPGAATVSGALQAAGFTVAGHESFLVQPDLQDFFLYSGKYDPAMYLDENVRTGISAFASLATPEEIEAGCTKLKHDMETDRIDDIVAKYSSYTGDYMFIVAEK